MGKSRGWRSGGAKLPFHYCPIDRTLGTPRRAGSYPPTWPRRRGKWNLASARPFLMAQGSTGRTGQWDLLEHRVRGDVRGRGDKSAQDPPPPATADQAGGEVCSGEGFMVREGAGQSRFSKPFSGPGLGAHRAPWNPAPTFSCRPPTYPIPIRLGPTHWSRRTSKAERKAGEPRLAAEPGEGALQPARLEAEHTPFPEP